MGINWDNDYSCNDFRMDDEELNGENIPQCTVCRGSGDGLDGLPCSKCGGTGLDVVENGGEN